MSCLSVTNVVSARTYFSDVVLDPLPASSFVPRALILLAAGRVPAVSAAVVTFQFPVLGLLRVGSFAWIFVHPQVLRPTAAGPAVFVYDRFLAVLQEAFVLAGAFSFLHPGGGTIPLAPYGVVRIRPAVFVLFWDSSYHPLDIFLISSQVNVYIPIRNAWRVFIAVLNEIYIYASNHGSIYKNRIVFLNNSGGFLSLPSATKH